MRQILLLFLLASATCSAQSMGNYLTQRPTQVTNANVQFRAVPRAAAFTNQANVVEINVSALSNQTASSHVAIFSVFQAGKTVRQVNEGMDERLAMVRAGLAKAGISKEDILVDLVNFLPTYAFESEKKIFSKKTLTEVPTGFNLQKNLHVRYRDPELINDILSVVAEAEIYDIIKVDYAIDDPQAVYEELRAETFAYLDKVVSQYSEFDVALDTAARQVAESAWVVYPGDRYESYTAHSSQKLSAKEQAEAVVTKADKPTLRFYNAIPTNDYDLVINPGVFEPAAQFSYSLKVRFTLYPKATPPAPQTIVKTEVKKQFYYLNGDGNMVPLVLE